MIAVNTMADSLTGKEEIEKKCPKLNVKSTENWNHLK